MTATLRAVGTYRLPPRRARPPLSGTYEGPGFLRGSPTLSTSPTPDPGAGWWDLLPPSDSPLRFRSVLKRRLYRNVKCSATVLSPETTSLCLGSSNYCSMGDALVNVLSTDPNPSP